jgi:hypothetical protein
LRTPRKPTRSGESLMRLMVMLAQATFRLWVPARGNRGGERFDGKSI